MSIPFIDLQAQKSCIEQRIQEAIAKVLAHGKFILGPEVEELEDKLSTLSGAKHTITCGNGTDAITLALMAEGVGGGDAVFVPSFTFVASAEAPAQLGATPFFVDVLKDTFNIDPESVEHSINEAKASGLNPKAIIAVDMFGQPAEYDALNEIAKKHDLVLIADAAQSFGGSYYSNNVGSLGDYSTTSFFPAKPLGCYGDGGAIFTDSYEKADLLRSLRFHGKGENKYDNVRIGLNSRLDTIQAAILLQKLTIFPDELISREAIANRYKTALAEHCFVPDIKQHSSSAWALYTIQLPNRDGVADTLKEMGIPSVIYYPIPLNKQYGYSRYPTVQTGCPISEELSKTVLSLPMHPYLDTSQQDKIIEGVISAIKQQG